MRRRGWGGDPPSGDDEALARILDAAAAIVREHGPDADIQLVAERLGVTRQTIYRYFVDRNDVFGHVALRAVDEFVADLLAHVGSWTDPLDRLVHALGYATRRLPTDPRLAVLVKPEIASALLLSADARDGMRMSLELTGLAPSLAPAELGRFARLVHALLVTDLLVSSTESEEELLTYFHVVLAPFFRAAPPVDDHSV